MEGVGLFFLHSFIVIAAFQAGVVLASVVVAKELHYDIIGLNLVGQWRVICQIFYEHFLRGTFQVRALTHTPR